MQDPLNPKIKFISSKPSKEIKNIIKSKSIPAARAGAVPRTRQKPVVPIRTQSRVIPKPQKSSNIISSAPQKHNSSKNQQKRQKRQTKKQPRITYRSTPLTQEQIGKIASIENSASGRIMVILGNGPSLNLSDTSKLANQPLIDICSINVPDDRCWPTKYWAFYDVSQFRRHKDLLATYSGVSFNSTGIKTDRKESIKFKNINGIGFSRDLKKGIYIGMSSVYATIQIALFMSFSRIFILGCDMREEVSETHFYGTNPDVPSNKRKERFKKEENWYNHAAEVLSENERKRITFCSKGINPRNFMEFFDTEKAENSIQRILNEQKVLRGFDSKQC